MALTGLRRALVGPSSVGSQRLVRIVMFDLQTLCHINAVAHELALRGLPERDALFLVTDPRRREELSELRPAIVVNCIRILWQEGIGD